jgi:hypothetical protein
MADSAIPNPSGVRTAEIIAAISMATDLAMGFPLEHGLRSSVIAARLCDRLGVDRETASQAYFLSLLFYVGCNAPADVGWDVFGDDDSLTTYASPFRFGSRAEMARGMMRAVAPPTAPLELYGTGRVHAKTYLAVQAHLDDEAPAANLESDS